MENPAFTVELDLAKGSSYGGSISDVRKQLVVHAGATRHLDLVLLRPQELVDPRNAPWFGVTLRCGSGQSALLRIRADNLYLCGYRSSAGLWSEFRGSSLINGAAQLACADSYGDMARVSGMALDKLVLGKEELQAAAAQLAANAGTRKETARSLLTISVMVCEAIRFRSVGGVVGHMMCNTGEAGVGKETRYNPVRRGVLPAHMVKQVTNWSRLSESWLGAALYGQPFKLDPPIEADASQQYDYIPQHLLAPAKIEDCQDHAMMALGVALNRQTLNRPTEVAGLQTKHQKALDKHWKAVRAQACKLDRERASTSSR